jgi:hypothetical protein
MLTTTLATLIAQADNPGKTVGENIKDLLQGLAVPLYLGLVGIMALGFLAGRKIAGLAVFMVVALGIGILVMNPEGFGNIVKSIGDAVSRNV